MHLKFALILLSCSYFIAADRFDDGTRYLRKLKKDKAKDDQGWISTEMLKTFDMSETRLVFGDWMDIVNETMAESTDFEASDMESEKSIDLDVELGTIHEADTDQDDATEYDSAQLSPTPESDLGLDMNAFTPDVSNESLIVDAAAPGASPKADTDQDDATEDDTAQPSPAPESGLGLDVDAFDLGISNESLVLDNAVPDASLEDVEDNVESSLEEEAWNHGATSVAAKRSGTITFKIPDTTHVGDTLFLFLSRTDGVLPLNLPRWNRGAECFKSSNRQKKCLRALHCAERNGPYCSAFERDGVAAGNGRDLSTVVFYRHVEEDDPCEWTLNLAGGTTTWAIVVSVPNVNREQPIQMVAGTSCDRTKNSVFPSVFGNEGSVLLLSQSFDDTAVLDQFLPPVETTLMSWTRDFDEAGFVYGKRLEKTGWTGLMTTTGIGGPLCKDALISLVVNID